MAPAVKGKEEGTFGFGAGIIVGSRYCSSAERELTVRKTSLFYPGDGFAVYEHHQFRKGEDQEEEGVGELVFRVDSYGGPEPHRRKTDELVLMGPEGECILTVRRKRPSLHQRWEGFLAGADDKHYSIGDGDGDGDGKEEGLRQSQQHPLFSVRWSSIIGRLGGGRAFLVEVYPTDSTNGRGPLVEYHVEGSFAQRCCTVHEACAGCSGRVVAEISRKVDASTNVVLGRDVFCLHLSRGFDAAFAMGLVLVLDQIHGNEQGHGNDVDRAVNVNGSAKPMEEGS